MSKLTLLGDIHGYYDEYLNIIKDTEYSIQLGDFGFDYSCLQDVDSDRHKIILGNHDNYDNRPEGFDLGDYGLVTFYDWDFFFVRGAFSIDCRQRWAHERSTGRRSWWENEQLSKKEMDYCLECYSYVCPDVILSHTCPAHISEIVGNPGTMSSFGWPENMVTATQGLLRAMWERHQPKLWCFGHYHKNWRYVEDQTTYYCVNELSTLTFNEDWKVV